MHGESSLRREERKRREEKDREEKWIGLLALVEMANWFEGRSMCCCCCCGRR
jgi:hypothetical protein